MKENSIRSFRRNLRRFERLNQIANTNCCRGITVAQCHVLLEIETLTRTTPKQLSENLWLDKSSLSRTVDGLKKLGFIRRDTNNDDRRFTILSLTRKGIEKCKSLNRYNDNLYSDIFERLSQKDRELFLQGFEKMVNAFFEFCQGKIVDKKPTGKECGCG